MYWTYLGDSDMRVCVPGVPGPRRSGRQGLGPAVGGGASLRRARTGFFSPYGYPSLRRVPRT